jgi:serine/threonine protein kinase
LKKTDLVFPKFPQRSKELTSFIAGMLEKNPTKRTEWKSIFEHHQVKEQRLQPNNNKTSDGKEFKELRKSIMEIGRSAAFLELISEPFNHQK